MVKKGANLTADEAAAAVEATLKTILLGKYEKAVNDYLKIRNFINNYEIGEAPFPGPFGDDWGSHPDNLPKLMKSLTAKGGILLMCKEEMVAAGYEIPLRLKIINDHTFEWMWTRTKDDQKEGHQKEGDQEKDDPFLVDLANVYEEYMNIK